MLVKSAKTVSREFYLDKHVYIGLTSYGYLKPDGVAKIIFCAKLVFVLFTISLAL